MLKPFNLLILKLNDRSAFDVNKMVMVFLRNLFVSSAAIAKLMALKDVCGLKQPHGAIDSCDAYARINLHSALVDSFDVRMVVSVGQNLRNYSTLTGHFETKLFAEPFNIACHIALP